MARYAEPIASWATDCRDKYAENHDSGYAGRLCLSDGALVWTAVISDGAGGSMEGLKVSALAIQAFVEALCRSTLAELTNPASREAWMRRWTKTLHDEAFARFKGGMATFCGAVLLPAGGASSPSKPSYRLFTLNVGDSQAMMLTGDGRCLGITPDAPPNNANVEGRNPVRVVGVAPRGDFALLDIEEFPVPAEGPVWVLSGSDGFFSKKKGKDDLALFAPKDFRDICLGSPAPFYELPALALRRSLENARRLGAAEMMDNATVAMLGLRVSSSSSPASACVSSQASPSSACGPSQATPSSACGRPRRIPSPCWFVIVGITALILGLALGALFGRSSAPPEFLPLPKENGGPTASPEP